MKLYLMINYKFENKKKLEYYYIFNLMRKIEKENLVFYLTYILF